MTQVESADAVAVAVQPAGPRRGVAPHPEQEGPRHLRVVQRAERTTQQRQRRARILLVGGIGAVLAVMFALVYLHVVLAQRQIELDKMTSAAASRQSAYQALRLQVAELESPQQIISTAEGRLGMRQPAQVTYVTPPAGAVAAGVHPFGQAAVGQAAADPATPSPAPSAPGTTAAPAGDANWPRIKAELASRP